MASTAELSKRAYFEQFKIPSTQPSETVSYMLSFADMYPGEWKEEKIESGINSSNPAVYILKNLTMFLNRYPNIDSNLIGYVGHEPGQTIGSPAGDDRFQMNNLKDSIAWTKASHDLNNQRPLDVILASVRPVVEEEIYLGFAYGDFMDDEAPVDYSSAQAMTGFVCATFEKYKIAKTKWLAIGNDNATGNRFI